MPYVHWEYEATFHEMNDYAQKVADIPISNAPPPSGKHQALMRAYMTRLDPSESEQNENKVERRPVDQLHIRRSLDQYYYHALKSTKDRDEDQLVSRMFKDGMLDGDPVLIVVDQLWLWVLENSQYSRISRVTIALATNTCLRYSDYKLPREVEQRKRQKAIFCS
jgi:hypothetical protein